MISKKVKLILCVLLLGCLMLQYQQFVNNVFVKSFQIPSKWINYGNISNQTTLKRLDECPPVTIHMVRNIKIDVEHLNTTNDQTIKNVNFGGRYSPSYCEAKHRVAIIIPLRDRMDNVRLLLRYLHPYLQRRHLEYGIFVVEQTNIGRFNKAVMMNTGFVEASKVYNYNCFIFHDADLLPENDGIPYTCEPSPLHLASAVDTLHYKLFYAKIFGGVTGFTPEHFKKVNGFSNLYFSWGGEDDEMYKRVINRKLKLNRLPLEVGRYKMLRHKKANRNDGNKVNQLLKSVKERQSTDGLNSLKSHIVKQELKRLYTWILVSINETEIIESGTIEKNDTVTTPNH